VRQFPISDLMKQILIATSNQGKVRDFAALAAAYSLQIASIPAFENLPAVIEDGQTFTENARKKAEHYSRFAPGELVVADDSGLVVTALGGAPGVHSARYAAESGDSGNSSDEANNAKLIRELRAMPGADRAAKFVCVIAVAHDGKTLQEFAGEVKGQIIETPRGENGFGYDPLFYFPRLGRTFAELLPEEKGTYSHRGAAFKKFLEWYRQHPRLTLLDP